MTSTVTTSASQIWILRLRGRRRQASRGGPQDLARALRALLGTVGSGGALGVAHIPMVGVPPVRNITCSG